MIKPTGSRVASERLYVMITMLVKRFQVDRLLFIAQSIFFYLNSKLRLLDMLNEAGVTAMQIFDSIGKKDARVPTDVQGPLMSTVPETISSQDF